MSLYKLFSMQIFAKEFIYYKTKKKMFDFLKTKKTYETISGDAARTLISENPSAIILDVRTLGEFNQGALKAAINVDFMGGSFKVKIAKLDKNKTYLVYCRSGNRSDIACSVMESLGFTKLFNLSGGIGNF